MEKITKHNLKLTLKYTKKYKWNFIKYIIFNIIIAILGAILPLITAQQILKLTNGLLKDLLMLSILTLVIGITNKFCYYFARTNAQKFSIKTLKNIQIDMAKEILKLETSELDKKTSGVFIERITRDTSKIADILLELNTSITDVITNIGILLAVFVINKYMFIYYVIIIILVFILEIDKARRWNEYDRLYRKTAEETTGIIGELVRGIRDIKVLNASKSFLGIVENKINEVNQERYNMSKTTLKYDLIIGGVKNITEFLTLLLGIFLINIKNISIANFLVIFTYRGKILNLMSYFSFMLEDLKDFTLSATRVFEIIDSNKFKKERFGTKHINKIKGYIEFRNVNFSYDNNRKILKDISFKVNENEIVSFVGTSGAGKSTIFSLLAKMYNINSGSILIDGININELDEDSIRGNLSIITQDPYIFNMSIKENLTSVKENLTDEEIVKACKLACLHDYIMSLPEGYNTIVGEGGLTLSGGQKQRLAIARALAQNTKIILFDEATSSLDNETQKSIQEAINNMKNKYTILIIAHRLSTVINSDRILLVEEGKISVEGTHKELLEKSKTYNKLYKLELEK